MRVYRERTVVPNRRFEHIEGSRGIQQFDQCFGFWKLYHFRSHKRRVPPLGPPADANVTDILLYHVIGGKYALSELIDENALFAFNSSETLNGQNVVFRHLLNSTYVNNALVLDSDVQANGSFVNVINKVLSPADCNGWGHFLWFFW